MDYKSLFAAENEEINERFLLAMERVYDIPDERSVNDRYRDYFIKVSEFIIQIKGLMDMLDKGETDNMSFEELDKLNKSLYIDITGDNYNTSYANPDYAVHMLGEEYGQLLCYLYAELRGLIVYAYEFHRSFFTVYVELFIQIYNLFEMDSAPDIKELKSVIYWFNSDYSDVFIEHRTREQYDYKMSFGMDILMNSDLSDLRYLYRYGEYISDNEIETARFINSLPEEDILTMANTMSEGYRIGFEVCNKDITNKELVSVQYTIGFERVIRQVIKNFADISLTSVVYRSPVQSIFKRANGRSGYYSSSPNRQYDFDHKNDDALYFDKKFLDRRISVLNNAYELNKAAMAVYAGPAVMETFGEVPFAPQSKKNALSYDDKQNALKVELNNKAMLLNQKYIDYENRSFTIIAFPIYEIGPDFPEIFKEIIKVNTLDYVTYRDVQSTIIDTLNKADYVKIQGMGDNKTDLKVNLWELDDPENQTKFENCVADVNIPVGEVFTSPKLYGTEGLLHVTKVFLNDLLYKDIKLTFANGKISDYNCANFDSEAENKKYIRENVLFNHDTLPIGEFAIGTNTYAYVMAERFGINDKMPILIAEKMGPHFAVGDTCYSHEEDVRVYNPDRKEIICKENEITKEFRKTDPSKAYFNCHTDITIPYDELGYIDAYCNDGSVVRIIDKGRFVLKGTELLNKPFEEK